MKKFNYIIKRFIFLRQFERGNAVLAWHKRLGHYTIFSFGAIIDRRVYKILIIDKKP